MSQTKRLAALMAGTTVVALLSAAAIALQPAYFRWIAGGLSVASAAMAVAGALWVVAAQRRNERMFDSAFADVHDAARRQIAQAEGRIAAIGGDADELAKRHSALRAGIQEQREAARRLAKGLDQAGTGEAAVEQARRLGSAVESEAAAIDQMVASIRSVSDTMGGLADTVNGVASAIAEMATSVTQVAANAQNANELSLQANTKAVDGGKAVEQLVQSTREIAEDIGKVVKRMEELGDASTRIGNIVEVIDAIADQTNLLALNAAIEAARAGEHGRGFAVVADEVRKLAESSAASTKEIGLLVRDIQQKTGEVVSSTTASGDKARMGLELADRAGRAIAEILSSVTESSHLISQISLTAREQAGGSQAIVQSVEQMNKLMRSAAASLDEQNASNAQMSESVLSMHNLTRVVTAAAEQQRAAIEGVGRLAAEIEAATQQALDAVEGLSSHVQRLHGELKAPQVAPIPLLQPARN